jgi:lysozyme
VAEWIVVDLSHWQGQHSKSDFAAAMRDGVDAFLFKASDGASYDDPVFRSNVAAAEAAGAPWGAYWFVEAGAAGPQVQNFVGDVKKARGRPACVMIDWERGDRSTAADGVKLLQRAFDDPIWVIDYLGNWARTHGGELPNADAAMVPSYGPAHLNPAYKPKHQPLAAWQYTDGKFNGTSHPMHFAGLGNTDASIVYHPKFFGIDDSKPKPDPKPQPQPQPDPKYVITGSTAYGSQKFDSANEAWAVHAALVSEGDFATVTRVDA